MSSDLSSCQRNIHSIVHAASSSALQLNAEKCCARRFARKKKLENSDRLLVNLLSQRIGNRNFPVTVMSRALERLNVNGPYYGCASACSGCLYFSRLI